MKRAAVLAAIVVLLPVVAGADLIVKEKTGTKSFMGVGSSEGTEVTYIKGDWIRTESETKHSGMMAGMMPNQALPLITIIRLDKGVVWHLNQDDRTYMEVSLKPEAVDDESADMRYEIKDITVSETDQTRKIAGYQCKGVNVRLVTEMARGEDKVAQTSDILFWMAPKTKELEEMQKSWEQVMDATTRDFGGPLLGDAMRRMSEALEDLDGAPLGMDITLEIPMPEGDMQAAEMQEAMKMMKQFMKGQDAAGQAEAEEDAEEVAQNQMKVSREVVSIETDKLDSSLFEIPADYKKAQAIRRW